MWRSIIILVTHFACVLLILSGAAWYLEGEGLHPSIALPSAIVLYAWCWIWIVRDAAQANQDIEDYLEWLEEQDQFIRDLPNIGSDKSFNTASYTLFQNNKSIIWWKERQY
jgi:hypothetical protein